MCRKSRLAKGNPDASKGGGRGGVEPALAGPGLNATGLMDGGEYDRKRGSTDGPGGCCCIVAGSAYPDGTVHDAEGGEFSGKYSGELEANVGTFEGKEEDGI